MCIKETEKLYIFSGKAKLMYQQKSKTCQHLAEIFSKKIVQINTHLSLSKNSKNYTHKNT